MRATIVCMACVLAGNAFALDPLGAPYGQLQEGQLSVGGEYSCTKADWTIVSSTDFLTGIRSGNRFDQGFARLGYGISDAWEIFARLGVSVADIGDLNQSWRVDKLGSGDPELSIGLGTKFTLKESGRLKLGAVIQASWSYFDLDREKLSGMGATWVIDHVEEWPYEEYFSGHGEILNAQMALGGAYQLTKAVQIFGGPFVYFTDGELEVDRKFVGRWIFAERISSEFEDSGFGLYGGVGIELRGCALFVEYQRVLDDDAHAISGGLIYAF